MTPSHALILVTSTPNKCISVPFFSILLPLLSSGAFNFFIVSFEISFFFIYPACRRNVKGKGRSLEEEREAERKSRVLAIHSL